MRIYMYAIQVCDTCTQYRYARVNIVLESVASETLVDQSSVAYVRNVAHQGLTLSYFVKKTPDATPVDDFTLYKPGADCCTPKQAIRDCVALRAAKQKNRTCLRQAYTCA